MKLITAQPCRTSGARPSARRVEISRHHAAPIEGSACDALVEKYLTNEQMRGYSPRTIERRRNTLSLFRASVGVRLAAATIDDVERFLGSRKSPSTRNAYLSDLRAFYGWSVKRGHLASDPTIGIERPKIPKRMPSPLSDADVAKLLAAVVPGSVNERIVYLALFAGLRASEIADLRTEDLDFDTGVLVVRQGKGGLDAVLPMAPRLADVLRHRPPGPVAGAQDRTSVSGRVKALFRRIGIDARTHDLRHTFGTTAARAANGNVIAVRDLMRHSSVATTQRYIGWAPETAALVASMYSVGETS